MNSRYSFSAAPAGVAKCIKFSILSSDEIAEHSVVKVDSTDLFDKGVPKGNGLYDLRMGTIDKSFTCQTCNCDLINCHGHFGHIKLHKPMFNPSFIKTIYKILQCICMRCSKILVPNLETKLKKRQNAFKFAFDTCKKVTKCAVCDISQPKWIFDNYAIFCQFEENGNVIKNQVYGSTVLQILRKISNTECSILGFDPIYAHPKNMIIVNLLVPPPVVRPSVMMDSNSRTQDDLTHKLIEIVKTNNVLDKQNQQSVYDEHLQLLQYHINTYIDNELPGQPQSTQRTGRPIKSISQRIRTKEGRVRGNLMGKRVDFSSRTVITAEPNIRLDELGVPIAIAKNMTISEVVTSYNKDFLERCVRNGVDNNCCEPGAKFVIHNETQKTKDLRFVKIDHLQIGDVVERHLMDGDYVVFNRQPTLHKMSMMGHRVKVMSGETFRLNLSATTPYNADFDGDEMNMHVPCSLESRAEVKELMMVSKNIVSPQSNRPVMGIVQDALLACRIMTERDVFVDTSMFMNLIMKIPNQCDKPIPIPAILKPIPLWSGKQIFNLLLPEKQWVETHSYSGWHDEDQELPWFSVSDTEVIIDKYGYYVAGIMCKKTVGPASNGLIHKFWLHGSHTAACDFISHLQYICNGWLNEVGFSVGVKDCVNRTEAQKKVDELINVSLDKVSELTKNSNTTEGDINKLLNSARDNSGKFIQSTMSSKNNLYNMVSGGSKGSIINIAQIMACVGQQNINGHRIAYGYTDRTLPHFKKHDIGYESKGFVKNSYMKGLTPTEFFFHAMGGREGVIDTAIKTSETGYIQRRLVKAMEDISVGFDTIVRNSIGDILQFKYGEDGFDGSMLVSQKLPDGQTVHLPVDVKLLMKTIHLMKTNETDKVGVVELNTFIETIPNRLLITSLKHHTRNVSWNRTQFENFMNQINETLHYATVNPGEMVGTVAAQSLGQPITQMTLNTFHAAGISTKNVTLGVPRLKELINLTKIIKSPSMCIYLKQPLKNINHFTGTTIHTFVSDYEIYENLPFYDFEERYIDFMEIDELKDAIQQTKYVAILQVNISQLKKHNMSIIQLTMHINNESDSVWCSSNFEISENPMIVIRLFANNTLDSFNNINTFIMKILQDVHVKGYKNVIESYKNIDPHIIDTHGSDLSTLLCDPLVDFSKSYTNDILDMYSSLGIEAARKALLNEIKNVIEFDGSYVNYRHLSVLVDTMTYKGNLMAITRHGINRTETGVLMRCSFEETINIITEAAVHGEDDNLKGVTENIIMGKLAKIGTGIVDILMKLPPEVDETPNNEDSEIELAFCPSSPTRDTTFIKSYFP